MNPRRDRTEMIILVLIVLVVGGFAGAASFTHVHDWTMRHSPPGTGQWFGWANAVISELTPTAAALAIRRRKRRHQPVAYPMILLAIAAALSLTAQVAEATHSLTGWIVAAIPALAFLALTKLVLSEPATPAPATTTAPDQPRPVDTTSHPAPALPVADPLPPELLTGARMAAFSHRQATGHDITSDILAAHLAIPADLAQQLLHALDDTAISEPTSLPVTHPNGTGPAASRP
jgi:Protein of unknown function (DUF2637)